MRLLHTSDWHLGRGLHGVDLHQAQESMVDQIVSTARSEQVDAVLICGDIFDRAVPPVSSVALWSRALVELSDIAPVVVIPGNHDSATRLGVGAALYREGVHVVTQVTDIGTPVELSDEHGAVLVYPVPFLDPDTARHALSDDDEPLPRSHEAVLGAAMHRIRRDVASRRESVSSLRSVVMAHAFVVAGSEQEVDRSDSERDIRVGGADSVASEIFSGVDYVALGHLHGAQRVAGDGMRYSGSPLRYSFSEVHHQKQALLVDLAADGLQSVTSVPIHQPRPMATLHGTLSELLESPEFASACEAWVQVTVTDAARPAELLARVRERFPEALVVRHVPASGPLVDRVPGSTAVPSQPSEVAEAFVRYVTGGDITPAELDAFESAYERVLADGRSA
jgi:exonuclease SbcD